MNNSDIITRYLAGSATEEEVHEINEWRQQIGNEAIFSEYEKIWKATEKNKQIIFPDTEQAWEKFNKEIDHKRTKVFKKNALIWFGAAAVVIPVFLFVFLSKNKAQVINVPVSQQAQKNMMMSEISTTDSVLQYILPDSSVVWLNKNSKLIFPEKFTPLKREVKLEGECFFEVRKDDQRPFIIYAATSITNVTGTSFNLSAYKNANVELTVETGKVEFYPSDNVSEKIILSNEEKVQLNTKTLEVTKTKNTDKSFDEWKGAGKQHKFKKFLGKIKKIFKKES